MKSELILSICTLSYAIEKLQVFCSSFYSKMHSSSEGVFLSAYFSSEKDLFSPS